MRIAMLTDWKAAVLAAIGSLSHGSMGAFVRSGETWPDAIVREAGQFLASGELGRSKGKVEDAWIDVVISYGRRGSAAPDGRVACEYGVRLTLSEVAHRAGSALLARCEA